MRILVFQHVDVEHPAIFRDFLAEDGIAWDAVELDAGESIPPLDGYDQLWVMGGPMDAWEEDRHPWLIAEKQAIREAAPHYEENMKMFGELRLVRALTDEQIAAMRDPRLAATTKLPRIEDAVKAGGFLAGRPEDIVEQLKAVEQRYPGLERVICTMPLGTPIATTLEQIERFATEVMPAFKTEVRAAAAD